jgi:predicted transcriptional regulator
MNFNVYLDDPTVDRLNALARKRGTTRNALIREAISHLLARKEVSGWPEAVAAFEGDAEAPRFEASRDALKPPRQDPLA